MKYAILFGITGSILALGGCAGNRVQPTSKEAAEPEKQEKKVVAAAKPITVELPAGTRLPIRTTATISTKTASPGDQFTGVLEQPLIAGGTVVAAKGADVVLQVVDAHPGGRVKGRASLTVRPTQLRAAHGAMVSLVTDSHTRVAPASKKKDAIKVGVASGVGAAIGAIAGGGKGAAIGAASGAGAGAGYVMATRGEPAVIPAESVLTFQTSAPLRVNTP
jgi:hypothetical protein